MEELKQNRCRPGDVLYVNHCGKTRQCKVIAIHSFESIKVPKANYYSLLGEGIDMVVSDADFSVKVFTTEAEATGRLKH